ncbi:hypothetical protein [Streptomyces sp. NPDC049949]|uniref:hypothetical protein n=1 Tax=Streptomyces sp. NPDC049949 TaxID=3154627 RepID=UPI0034299553
MNGAVVTGALSKALDAVVWDGLETRPETDPVEDVARALRRLASAGTEAVEEDCYPLHSLVTRDGCETPSAAAVALPFVIALAADPAMGVRVDLVDLLAAVHAPALAGEDWSGAWALLADPEPTVRRAATALPAGVARLLERWRVEADPTVRLPLLLALGGAASREAAPAEAAPAEAGEPAREARAVLAGVLEGDDPVLRLAAVHASAELDRELPVRQLDRLIEVFSDLALRPRFESVWYTPDIETPWTREDLVRSTALLLGHDPEAELSFAVRLVESARRSGDGALCREALDLAWRLLEAWGEDALPALPDLIPLLADTWTSIDVMRVLLAIGPAAAPAVPAVLTSQVLDDPGNHRFVARTAARLGADRAEAPCLVGEAVIRAEEPELGPIGGLCEFGRDAAPYAQRVRFAMENSTHWPRLTAAITLWEITGRVEPTMRVLEEFVLPIADGGDGFRLFGDALRALIRMGEISPAIREALLAVRQSDRRLSAEGGYPMVLRDQELRGLIEEAMACAAPRARPDRQDTPQSHSEVISGRRRSGTV